MKRSWNWALVVPLILSISGCLSALKKYESQPALAQYDGELKLAGLSGQVDIYRDSYGIPHIFADHDRDLFFAVGYVQAQDRLWEMVFLRAMGEGRLSELVGEVTLPGLGNTFQVDKAQRIMGMKWLGELGEALIQETDPESYRQLQAYCDGVNAFLASHQDWAQLPIEFQVLRVKPEPWRVADIISYGMMIGNQLGANMDEELLRYALIKKYGPDRAWQLFPLHYALGPTIVPNDMLKNKLQTPRDLPPGGRPSDAELGYTGPLSSEAAFVLAKSVKDFKTALYIDTPLASNNWVVSGKLTESGNAMLANDPHLEHIEPSLFYLMHLKSKDIDAFGAAFAGVPFPVLGHTRKLSWGATTPPADVQDLFIETTDPQHPGQYLYQGEWKPFIVRKEIIRVRMGSRLVPREIKIQQTVHGPVINEIAKDLPKDTPPLALRWTAWDFSRDLRFFDLVAQSATVPEFMQKIKAVPKAELKMMSIAQMYNILMRGSSIADFVKAMDTLVAPVQNWVAADADGHIAYLPGGLTPIRKKGLGLLPVPGEKGEFDWTGFIPLMELPYAIDPGRGYMASANNPLVDQRYYPYVIGFSYDEGWRAWRIEELIKELAPLSMDDMKRIQNDVRVKRAVWQLPIMLKAVDRQKPEDPLVRTAAEELKNWDCEASLTATAPVLFFEFNRRLRTNMMADEVEPGDYEKYLDSGMFDYVVLKALDDGASPLADDKNTRERVETLDDMIVKSLHDAMAYVTKTYGPDPKNREWGKLHTITWENPIGIGPLKVLNVGPWPHLGGRDTVRAAGFSGKGKTPELDW